MAIYITFFIGQIVIILAARLVKLKNNLALILLLISASSLFAALRGNTGTDTFAYRNYYDNVTLASPETSFEPMLATLSLFGNYLGYGSQFLIAGTAILQGIFIFLTAKMVRERDLYYLVVMSTYFTYFNLNQIRAGLAIYILGFSLLLVRRYARIGFFVAVLTHFSVFIFSFAYWKRWYLLLPVVAVGAIIARDLLEKKIIAHFLESNIFVTNFSIGIGFFVATGIIIFCLWKRGLLNNNYVRQILLAFVVFKIIGYAVPIIDRLAIIFEYALFVLLLSRPNYKWSRLLIVALVIYNTYRSLVFIYNSDYAMDRLISLYPGMASLYSDVRWVPYRFFWE